MDLSKGLYLVRQTSRLFPRDIIVYNGMMVKGKILWFVKKRVTNGKPKKWRLAIYKIMKMKAVKIPKKAQIYSIETNLVDAQVKRVIKRQEGNRWKSATSNIMRDLGLDITEVYKQKDEINK